MATISFREGINELLLLMQEYPNLAIMCAEAVLWRCHRRMIADYLVMVEDISDLIFLTAKNSQLPMS